MKDNNLKEAHLGRKVCKVSVTVNLSSLFLNSKCPVTGKRRG